MKTLFNKFYSFVLNLLFETYKIHLCTYNKFHLLYLQMEPTSFLLDKNHGNMPSIFRLSRTVELTLKKK